MTNFTLQKAYQELKRYYSEVGSNTLEAGKVGIYKDNKEYFVMYHEEAEDLGLESI